MAASPITLTAPAKINLSLLILEKRSDGYHEIETLMAPLALADQLELDHAPKNSSDLVAFSCNDPTLPTDANNLCVQAAHLFQKTLGIQEPVSISLLKKIPHGAGLGGGSSDAAAVLRGLNSLFEEPFVLEELHQLATPLGSDVPFFLDPKPAWCRGRGELLSEASSLPTWKLLLIKPPFSISTAWAYSRLQKEKKSNTIIVDGISIFNDFEAPIFKKYLQLPILKSWLQDRSEVTTAWMTGSGSTIVALLNKESSVEEIGLFKKTIADEFGETFWIKETRFL
jgi:4-diphosphocytidyl-2-C-methyl-D-erythritol kinase